MTSDRFAELKVRLAGMADEPDREFQWPIEALRLVMDAGWRGFCIDARYGGARMPAHELQAWYEALGSGDLSVALIVTQHDAAVDLIAYGENEPLKERLLPRFASGEMLATVGISQLTTSRQGGEPAMKVTADGDAFRFDGLMPWVTSAAKCTHIVTGGVMADGRQVLACISSADDGVIIDAPVPLMSLNSSWTSQVRCNKAYVPLTDVIRGPIENVLSRRSPIKPLTVSSIGVGLAGALLELIESLATDPDTEFRVIVEQLRGGYLKARSLVFRTADRINRGEGTDAAEATEIRISVNDLVGRLALAGITIAKGTGFALGHRAQRLVRQAMFMLVWSAPRDVRVGTLSRLANAACI